jgi:protein-disulfide isomerase
MKRNYSWLLVLLVVAMLVAACGPEMSTPTPAATTEGASESQATALPEPSQAPTEPALGELPVNADDWHVLGSPDAPVTMFEFSDFQ